MDNHALNIQQTSVDVASVASLPFENPKAGLQFFYLKA